MQLFASAGKPAKFCSEHKQDGMVNPRMRTCQAEGCGAHATFKHHNQLHPSLCAAHKIDGMVHVRVPLLASFKKQLLPPAAGKVAMFDSCHAPGTHPSGVCGLSEHWKLVLLAISGSGGQMHLMQCCPCLTVVQCLSRQGRVYATWTAVTSVPHTISPGRHPWCAPSMPQRA